MFDNDRLYPANDPAVLALAPYSTMAHWRCEGRGPAFIKIGSRVAYSGKALNEWLVARTVNPTDQPAPAAA